MSRELMVKVCGLRNMENVKAIAELGIAYAGFVFYSGSSRYVANEPDFEIPADLKVSCTPVAVFVDESLEVVSTVVKRFAFDVIQLHGKESAEYCQSLKSSFTGIKIIKALSFDENFDFSRQRRFEGVCDYFLFDSSGGGSGRKFDWRVLENYRGNIPYFLSGGIGPSDTTSIREFSEIAEKLCGVDINSRFETGPGIKSVEKVKEFLEEIRR